MVSPEPDGDLQNLFTTSETPCKETSPDSKCPICLDRFRNVSYADRCFHRFCFRCILEWGKNKAECPLCKQPFTSVYHSVRSEDDFKLYELRPAENGSFGSVQGQRFRYRTTLTHERRRAGQTRGTRSSQQQEVMHFRRGLYRRGVRVRGVRDGGRSRDTSAEFFRKNPACLHRLVPWLKRELAVLYGSHDSVADVVLHVILSLITRHDMQNEAFLRELRPFLLSRTEHFLHEFLSFVKSPFNMEAYDRYAVYDCPAPSPLSALSDDDADRSSAPSPWDDETPGPSYSSASQNVFTVTISDSDEDSVSEDETIRINADANAQVDEGDHNSDDDCVIIGFIKPTVQRTPELVQLSTDSEASVQDEPVPSTSRQSDTRGLTNQRSHHADDVPSHSDKKRNSTSKHKHRERSYSSNSHRQRSRSLSYKHKRRSKATYHSSLSHTCSQAHQRLSDTHYRSDTSQPSHACSRSKIPSCLRSNTFSRSACAGSRTRAHSGSRTHARSGSRSRARSGSRTHAHSGSRSRARSGSRTHAHSGSRSRARSGSRTHAHSGSMSRARSGSRSRARSGSWARARSGSRSRARSGSRTRARLGSRSRARSRSRSRAHSGSRTRARSRSRSRARSGSRSRACYYSGRWKTQASPQNTKRFKCLSVSPYTSSHEKPCGKWKNKSLDGERRRRSSREKHHHSKKKSKKRRQSSSVDIVTERRKHHKKKKKHKTKRKSRSERLGRSSEGSSPAVSTIHTNTDMRSAEEAPRDAVAAHSQPLSSSHEETATCPNISYSSTNCAPDTSLFSISPTVNTPSLHTPSNITPE